MHTGDKPHQCSNCDTILSNNSILSIHMKTHTRDKPHQCTSCDMAFSNISDLLKHERTQTGENLFNHSHEH